MKDEPNEFIQHYTDLPNIAVLMSQHQGKLTCFEEYLVISDQIMSQFSDTAYYFSVSPPATSRILLIWLTIMDIRLSPLILWPERQDI